MIYRKTRFSSIGPAQNTRLLCGTQRHPVTNTVTGYLSSSMHRAFRYFVLRFYPLATSTKAD